MLIEISCRAVCRQEARNPLKSRFLDQKAHWMLVANLSPALAMWLVAILIARTMGAEPLGRFAFANAVVTPIMLVMQLPLRTLHITGRQEHSDLRPLLGLRLSAIGVGLTAIAIMSVGLSSTVADITVMTAVALYRACDAYCDLLHGGLQRADQLGSIACLVVSRSILVSATAVWCAMHQVSLEGLTLAMAGMSMIAAILIDTRICNRHTPIFPIKFGAQALRSHAGRIVPLSVTQGLSAFSGNVPRYIVQAFGGTHMLGLFAALEHVALATSMLVNALGQSMTAPMARLWNSGRLSEFRQEAKRLILATLVLGGVMLALTFIGAETVLNMVYGAEFLSATPYLVVASFVALVVGVVSALGYSLTASGAFQEQPRLLLFSTTVSIVVGLVAVPMMGLGGVYLSILLAAAVQILLGGRLLYARMRGVA